MPDEYAAQRCANIAESLSALAETVGSEPRIFGLHKKGAIPFTYRAVTAAGTVPAIYRLNRCAASPRLSVIHSAHSADNVSN